VHVRRSGCSPRRVGRPVWIDEVWPGLAAQLGQVVQAHPAGDGLPPNGKSKESPTRQRTCRVGAGGNGNAAGLADRLGSAAAARPTSLGCGLTEVQVARPVAARGSLGQRQIQPVEQSFQPNLELLGAMVLTEQRFARDCP
jgi:hypothetical protein